MLTSTTDKSMHSSQHSGNQDYCCDVLKAVGIYTHNENTLFISVIK